MNRISQSVFIENEKRWYYLSLFYARENWSELISEIMRFYQERQNQFCNCLLSFSKEKGEHIQIAFATFGNNNNNYIREIQTYFQTFIDQNPSISRTPFPNGQAVWCNYPNNSLTWNKPMLLEYSESYISFHQQTMEVALKLLDGDFSEDTFFSLGLYLITKALCCIDKAKQENDLSQALYDTSVGSPHFVYAVKELSKEINMNEIGEAIESYRNENEYSQEMINWLNEVKIILNRYNYSNLCTFVCGIIGLKGLRQLMILEIMNR